MAASRQTGDARWRPISVAICVLIALAAVSFAVASIIHFGIVLDLGPVTIDDPFPGAAVPEAVIAAVLTIGALSVMAHWPARWATALATTLFALLLTIYGLTVTVGSARTGDVIYHICVLTLSVAIVGLLLLPAARRGLSG